MSKPAEIIEITTGKASVSLPKDLGQSPEAFKLDIVCQPVPARGLQWSLVKIQTGDHYQGAADSLAELDAGLRAVETHIWLAPRDVLILKTRLPVTHPRKIEAALPYALEDLLASPVEDLSFAYTPLADGDLQVAVVDTELIDQIIATCRQQGLNLKAISPLATLTHNEPPDGTDKDWRLVYSSYGSWAELSTNELIDVEPEDSSTPPSVLALAAARAGDGQPERLVISSDEPIDEPAWSNALGVSLEIHKLDFWQRLFECKPKLGFARDQLGGEDSQTFGLRAYRFALAALAALVISQMGLSLWQYSNLRSEADSINANMTKMFRRHFPNQASVIVDPYRQIMRNLDQTRSINNRPVGYLGILAHLSPALDQSTVATLESLRYSSGVMVLVLRTQKGGSLTGLLDQWRREGLKVSSKVLGRNKNVTRYRIKVTGK